MIPGGTIALLLSLLAALPWADEVVEVEDRGAVSLASYACTEITRSSIIDRVCYDAVRRRAIIQVRSVYRQYCDLPQATLDALLNAPSMGQFYRHRIAGVPPCHSAGFSGCRGAGGGAGCMDGLTGPGVTAS